MANAKRNLIKDFFSVVHNDPIPLLYSPFLLCKIGAIALLEKKYNSAKIIFYCEIIYFFPHKDVSKLFILKEGEPRGFIQYLMFIFYTPCNMG